MHAFLAGRTRHKACQQGFRFERVPLATILFGAPIFYGWGATAQLTPPPFLLNTSLPSVLPLLLSNHTPPLSPCLNVNLARSKGGFDADDESCFGSPSSSEDGISLGGFKELQIFPMMTMAKTHSEDDGVRASPTDRSASSDKDTETSWVPSIGAPGWTTPVSESSERNKNSTKNDSHTNDDDNDDNDDNDNHSNGGNGGSGDNPYPSKPGSSLTKHRPHKEIAAPEPSCPTPRRFRPPKETFPLTDAGQELPV